MFGRRAWKGQRGLPPWIDPSARVEGSDNEGGMLLFVLIGDFLSFRTYFRRRKRAQSCREGHLWRSADGCQGNNFSRIARLSFSDREGPRLSWHPQNISKRSRKIYPISILGSAALDH